MKKFFKKNKKNISISVLLVVAFYMILFSLFSIYLQSGNEYIEIPEQVAVLGVEDSLASFDDIDLVVETFLEAIWGGDVSEFPWAFGYNKNLDFLYIHEVKDVAIIGEVVYEKDTLALVPFDITLFARDRDFEFSLVILAVFENVYGQWLINDVEYSLERYNVVLN